MAELLLRIHKRSLPGFKDYHQLLKLLTETQTGLKRIRSALPDDATLAHKTGTHRTIAGINIATNDAGIITLPDGQHLILVVFLKGATVETEQREKVLADVARAVLAYMR